MVSAPSEAEIHNIAFTYMAKVFDAYGAPDLTEEGYAALKKR